MALATLWEQVKMITVPNRQHKLVLIRPSHLEVGGNLGTAELELLDDVGYLFEAMRVASRVPLRVSDHEERSLLEQQYLN